MALIDSWPSATDDSGSKTDGTIINEQLLLDIKAAIELLIHTNSNYLLTPANIIDEVVAARGSLASLSARLAVSQNADGSLTNGTLQRYNTTVADTPNAGAAETNLIQYTLPANTLRANGQFARMNIWGTTAANGNNKNIKAYFGATSLSLLAGIAANALNWEATVWVVRTGAASQVMFGSLRYGTNQAQIFPQVTPAETLSAGVILKTTGQGVAGSDVVQHGMIVEVGQ